MKNRYINFQFRSEAKEGLISTWSTSWGSSFFVIFHLKICCIDGFFASSSESFRAFEAELILKNLSNALLTWKYHFSEFSGTHLGWPRTFQTAISQNSVPQFLRKFACGYSFWCSIISWLGWVSNCSQREIWIFADNRLITMHTSTILFFFILKVDKQQTPKKFWLFIDHSGRLL